MSFKSFISRLISSTEKKSQLAHGCTPHPQNFLPLPVSCDFSWQFVSLNVWWHVHLLLLYMCITGYKGVFEHSKHVLLSHLSFSGWTFPFFGFSHCFNFFLHRETKAKTSLYFFHSLSCFGTFDGHWGVFVVIVVDEISSSFIYIWFNQYFFSFQTKQRRKKERS